MNEKDKKKILIGSIVIVIILILVIVGTTYAFFALEITGDNTNSTVHITTGEASNIELSGELTGYHIKVNVSDMAYNNRNNEYYGTDIEGLNYVTDKDLGTKEIGKVKVNGTLKEKNICSAKVKIEKSGNMEPQKGDITLTIINYRENGNYEQIIDISDIKEIEPLEFILKENEANIEESIKAYLTFKNQDKDQSYLADKTLSLTIKIEEFACEADTAIPSIEEFYIKDKTDKYTNVANNTVHLAWLDDDVKEYCITEIKGSNNCTWKKSNNQKVIEEEIELKEEKVYTYYAYIKDKVGNISLEVSNTITYDITDPTIQKVDTSSITENSITISVTPNADLSGVSEYCYAQAQAGPYTCKSENTNSYGSLQVNSEYDFWIYLKDKAGNGTQDNVTQYKFKTLQPLKDILGEKTGLDYLKTAYTGDELTRYIGQYTDVNKHNVNNYICFGTNNLETCTNSPKTYMYRIIGITNEKVNRSLGLVPGQLKLIKAYPSNTSQQWHSDHSLTINWDNSLVCNYLNTTFLNSITGKLDTKNWQDLISKPKWYIGKLKDAKTGDKFSVRKEVTTTVSDYHKIGLMYSTDYVNSSIYVITNNNWIFISHGISESEDEFKWSSEWTMTRYGENSTGINSAWYYSAYGGFYVPSLDEGHAVRPVFYITPDITLSGEGTEDNPYIIHTT